MLACVSPSLLNSGDYVLFTVLHLNRLAMTPGPRPPSTGRGLLDTRFLDTSSPLNGSSCFVSDIKEQEGLSGGTLPSHTHGGKTSK